MPTAAERVILASRAAVWAAASADDEADVGWHQQIVGAPVSGVGAKHVHIGPPAPPFGMRTVTYVEVTAFEEGYWYSTQTLAGAWEHTETFMLEDVGDGKTLARIRGWWTKPSPRGADFTVVQAHLNELAANALARLADRVEGDAAHAAPDGPI